MIDEAKIEAARNAGYECGLRWSDAWQHEPGGPFACDEQSRMENAAWRQGWRRGNAERKRRIENATCNRL